jgi:phospholipid/cholesterol/gamma-HCH transport system substrate-binding protein
MESKANYTLIGAAVLLLFVAAAGFAVWISRVQFDAEFAVYDVVFPGTIRGLDRGGEVRFNGIKVGEVTNLRFDADNPKQVVARIRVDANAPVKVDSVAQLEQVGLTGVALIQISGGGDNSPLLKSQARLNYVPRLLARQSQLDVLFESGESIATNAARALNNLNGVLNAENAERVSAILTNIELVSAQLAEQRAIASDARIALQQVAAAGREIGRAADAIRELSGTANARLDGVAGSTELTLAETRLAIASLNAAAEEARVLADRAGQTLATANAETLPEITRTAEDLRRLSTTLEALADDVQSNPLGLLSGSGRPAVEGVAP